MTLSTNREVFVSWSPQRDDVAGSQAAVRALICVSTWRP
jgi:hypothetical protein